MFSRSFRAGLVATTLVTAGLGVGLAGTAQADPSTPPGGSDYVGVGSDTTQYALTNLINGATVAGTPVAGYNSSVGSGSPKMASWDACTTPSNAQFPCTTGGQITLRSTSSASIDRPPNSGGGKNLLHAGTNNNDVTFARSSSGLSTTEANDGLVAYPFALDTLVVVTSKNVATHAPATLTGAQIVSIYKGTATKWSDVGGSTNDPIVAYVPPAGSGTRSFFEAQLKALNGNTAVTYGPNVNDTAAQEHDPTKIQNDANAIAPFSRGRAVLAGSVQIEKGWSADRALYNVLRSSSTNTTNTSNLNVPASWLSGSTQMESIFGTGGFICSAQARPLIEAAGFKQLKSTTDGGACGSPTTSTASSLSAYNADGLASKLAVTVNPGSVTYGQGSTASVKVSGTGGVPTGSVVFTVGSFSATVPLSNGAASTALPANLPAGTRSVNVAYTGDDTFKPGTGSSVLSVARATSSTSASFPGSVKKNKAATGTVVVNAGGVVPTGSVTILKGATVVGTYPLAGGSATVTLPKQKKAKGKKGKKPIVFTVTYPGDANVTGSSTTFQLKQK